MASFVGENNCFRGKVSKIIDGQAIIDTNRTGALRGRIATGAQGKLSVGDDAMMFIRPEGLSLTDKEASDTRIMAEVHHSEFEGQSYNVFLEGTEGKEMKMALTNQGEAQLFDAGSNLAMSFDAHQAVIVPAGELASE